MPRREDIEKFAQVLRSLGDEPAIRAARSEKAEEGLPAGETSAAGAPAGEEEPLGSLPEEAAGPSPEAGPEELSALSVEAEEPVPPARRHPPERRPGTARAPEPAEEPAAEPLGPEGLDFSSLLGQAGEEQPIDEALSALEPELGAEAQPGEEPGAGAEEEFSLPEGELPGLQSDLAQMEVLPEEAEQAGPTAPAAAGPAAPGDIEAGREPGPGEPPPEPGPFEDLGSFSFDTTETAAAPLEQETAGEAAPAAEPGAAESFELPDLDSLSLAGPSAEEGMPGAAESPTPGPGAPEAGAPAAQPAAPAEESFDLDAMAFQPEAGLAEEAAPEGVAPSPPPDEAAAPEAPPGPEEVALDLEAGGGEGLGSLDEFTLPEGAQRFGVEQQAAPPPVARPRPRPAPRPPAPAEAELAGPGDEAGEITLTPQQFAQVKRTLESLPRNLKIAVQDLIGEGTVSGRNLRDLIDLLVAGASAQEIASMAGRITGRRIRIPPGYEKKTGAAFEAEQRTFGYALRQNILPLVRALTITVVFAALFGYLGYRFVYRPLAAISSYRAGYSLIGADQYALANDRFDAGVRVWPMKRWYFRYADAFSAKRQYALAEQKYDQLLAQFGYDRTALLDYASLESTKLADYEKADSLLARILDVSPYDYNALLASGDNDLEWAASVPARYEAGRLAYATLLNRYGVRDELLFRMLRYFIRTDNGTEVERLRAYYADRPSITVDPAAYAELGGYLVDHRRLDNAQEVLFRADKADPTRYDVHYNLARYYRIVGRPQDEKTALDHVVDLLKLTASQPLTRRRMSIEIDTHTRLGEWWYAQRGYIDAGNELRTSLGLIERNQALKLLDQDRAFGRAYAAYGDLFYYIQGDLPAAEIQYRKAIDNLYSTPSLTYKIGVIQYESGDYKNAMTTFVQTESAPPDTGADRPAASSTDAEAAAVAAGETPQNLLYALGNSFYLRGDYFAAQGSYLRLLARLESRRAAAGTLFPESQAGDQDLLEMIARVDNNLGVTMLRLGERTGDRNKRSQGLVYLTDSTQITDSLAKDLSSAQRSQNRSLASLNMRGILYPTAGFEPQIDSALPRDLQATSW